MLKILRRHSKHWVIGLVIGAIVVVFIFWGIGSRQAAQSQVLAQVYGEPISMASYYQFAALLEKKTRFRRSLSEEDYKHLRETAPDSLIRLTLLAEAAKRLGLTVSDAEVQSAILHDPDFQQEGVFDPRLYDMFIGRGRNREAEKVAYEKWLRLQLLGAKALDNIASFAKVSEAELQEYFQLSREAVQVDYLVVSPEPFAARIKPTDAELKEYYQKHEAELRIPDRVKVRYLLVQSQDFLKKVAPTPQELEDYLSDHSEDLTRPKVVRVREIFLALPAKAGASGRQQVKERAEELLKQARQGKDFAQLARAAAQDEAGRAQVGEPALVARGQKGEAWDKVAFALAPGEVGLAQTDKGFYLIMLESIQKTEPLPAPEAKARALELLKGQKSRELAREEAKRLQAEAATTPFPEVAKKNKLTTQETPLFTLTEPLAALGGARAFNQEAFTLKPQEVGLAEVPQGFAVMQAAERQAAHLPPFEEVKDQMIKSISRQGAEKMAAKEADQILARLRKGEPLAKVAAQAALPLRDSGYFTRPDGFLQQPLAEPLTSGAFQLSAQQPYPDKPIFWQGKYYLLAFKNRRLPSPEDFQKDREDLERRILTNKRQLLLEAWFKEEWLRAQVSKPRQPS
jgi:peptidyl-prolyl cis-trans isomerase D